MTAGWRRSKQAERELMTPTREPDLDNANVGMRRSRKCKQMMFPHVQGDDQSQVVSLFVWLV